MATRVGSIPIKMRTKKFYCAKCGERMLTKTKTRLVRRRDPDYKKYNTINHMHILGDIELSEYDFKCYSCDNVVDYDTQCVIAKIQKELHKTILSEKEILENKEKAKKLIEKQAKIRKVLSTIITILVFVLMLYFKIKSGDSSFKIYL